MIDWVVSQLTPKFNRFFCIRHHLLCLICPSNPLHKAFWLFLKVLFGQYCFTLDLKRFNFNVLADIRSLSSSMAVFKPLTFILSFVSTSHFKLVEPFFHNPLNQSSILLQSFFKTAISFSVLRF